MVGGAGAWSCWECFRRGTRVGLVKRGNWKTQRSGVLVLDIWGGRDDSSSILAVQSVTALRP